MGPDIGAAEADDPGPRSAEGASGVDIDTNMDCLKQAYLVRFPKVESIHWGLRIGRKRLLFSLRSRYASRGDMARISARRGCPLPPHRQMQHHTLAGDPAGQSDVVGVLGVGAVDEDWRAGVEQFGG